VRLGDHALSPFVHQGILFFIGVILAAACLLAALLLRRGAPAASLALASAAAVGTIASFVSSAHGHHGVPHDVGIWASVGLAAGGIVGLFVTRPRPSSLPLWRVGVTCLALSPFGAALVFLSVTTACPLYVTHRAGYCFYDFDMLGAWASGVTILFVLDVFVVSVLLFISGGEAKDAEPRRSAEDTPLNR
jgi:hypothetical protein